MAPYFGRGSLLQFLYRASEFPPRSLYTVRNYRRARTRLKRSTTSNATVFDGTWSDRGLTAFALLSRVQQM